MGKILIFFALVTLIACFQNSSEKMSDKKYFFREFYNNQPCVKNDRSNIMDNLRNKILQKQPLIIHVFVPLCDNENQGIVPVNESLGDGLNLKTNLYWGAGYGIKSHFKLHTQWRLVFSKLNWSDDVLERIVFNKKIGNADVFLVADAYRGDRMKQCLNDYFNAISGHKSDNFKTADNNICAGSASDLFVFNGHNGLMDISVDNVYNPNNKSKDAVVISCRSYDYFIPYLSCAGAYPLLTTSNLLAPEAYILEAIAENWALLKDEETIRLRAGDAYQLYQKCGLNASRKLFKTGW